MHWDKIQFFASLLSLICLGISYWHSLKEYKEVNNGFSKIKLVTVLVSLAAMVVWFKDLAKISFIFIIIAMAGLIKNDKNGEQNSRVDMGK